jgi:hypothetical protein
MPHCVLTLRLIGLAFDVYDGHKKVCKSNEKENTELKNGVLIFVRPCKIFVTKIMSNFRSHCQKIRWLMPLDGFRH